MLTTLKIGEKVVNVRASALTSVIFRNLFGKDLITEITAVQKKVTEDSNLDLFKQLAFVMSWQAMPRTEKTIEAMKSLSVMDYYGWLDDFEEADFFNASVLQSITGTWLNASKSVIDVKNQASLQ